MIQVNITGSETNGYHEPLGRMQGGQSITVVDLNMDLIIPLPYSHALVEPPHHECKWDCDFLLTSEMWQEGYDIHGVTSFLESLSLGVFEK